MNGEVENDLNEAIIILRDLSGQIQKEPDRIVTANELKFFMVSTTSAIMGLHILLRTRATNQNN